MYLNRRYPQEGYGYVSVDPYSLSSAPPLILSTLPSLSLLGNQRGLRGEGEGIVRTIFGISLVIPHYALSSKRNPCQNLVNPPAAASLLDGFILIPRWIRRHR